MNEKYYTGLCLLCHDICKVRHVNIYPVGSEGLYICEECENDILLPLIRDIIAKSILKKKEAHKCHKYPKSNMTNVR